MTPLIATLTVLLGSVFYGQQMQSPIPMPVDAVPTFDVVTIKPSAPGRVEQGFDLRGRHFLTMNTSVIDLITFAYGLNAKQIVDAPAWFDTDKLDIDGVPDVEGKPNLKQMKILIQGLLSDRFHLKFHKDQRELSVYALTVGKSGPKLAKTTREPGDPAVVSFQSQVLTVSNATMRDFCDGMQGTIMDRPVVDHTGLTDRYDFKIRWTPDESQFLHMGIRIPPPTDDPNAPPGLFTALQEQLGLKLEATKALTDVVVIDHVEKPSAN
jgi:uncharacterized protein (TIGR03435 family)